MHLSPAATEDAIQLLDGRQSGVEVAAKFGDILDTRSPRQGTGKGPPSRYRATVDNFRVITGERKLERATGIEPVSEAWEASVLPLY